jgi:hypothetical protein
VAFPGSRTVSRLAAAPSAVGLAGLRRPDRLVLPAIDSISVRPGVRDSPTGGSVRALEPNRAPRQAVGRSGLGPFDPGRSLAGIGSWLRRSTRGGSEVAGAILIVLAVLVLALLAIAIV